MTRGDKLIFSILVVFAILSLLFMGTFFTGIHENTVTVFVEGKEYATYPLTENTKETLEIQTEFGYNKIVIENGKVYVAETSCPDRCEVKEGPIDKTGELLVCLPNRLLIRIENGREVDGLAY